MPGQQTRTLWCFIDRDHNPASVNVPESASIDYLQEAIKEKFGLHDSASDLVLLKLNESVDLKPHDRDSFCNLKFEENGEGVEELIPWNSIGEYWPDQPPDKHLHIIVKAPTASQKRSFSSAEDDDHEAKRQRTDLCEAKSAIQTLPSDHPLYELWSLAREDHPTIFETCPVQRDNTSGTKLPSNYMVLKGGRWVEILQPNPSFTDILIRDEYSEALRAIKEWFLYENVVSEDTMEGEITTEVEDMQLAPLENPFLDILTSHISKTAAFVLLGNPGIGKTVFLYVLLVLRLQARLPTIYQSRDNRLYYFDDGVSQIYLTPRHLATDFASQFAPSTWCLIDSNQNLNKVPVFIQDLGLFIVQASSPRPDRFDWTDKATKSVLHYFMKSWTPSELLIGRVLQHKVCSEAQVESFYQRYGTSARLVYANASSPSNYDEALTRKMGLLTYERLDNFVKQTSALDLSSPVSHQIVLISPGPRRNTFRTSFQTRYLYEKLRDQLSTKRLETVARLYEIFVRASGTRSAAGPMLEDAVNDVFHRGGEWSLIRMERSSRTGSRFTHWKDPKNPTSLEYLHLGYEHCITIATKPNPVKNKYNKLEVVPYLQGDCGLQLRNGYYLPSSRSQATFDAFIYESASETATIFQVTVSDTHSVKEKGIKWLWELGVKKFRYIAVSTPNSPLALPFPNKWDALIPEKYLLAVDSLPTHID